MNTCAISLFQDAFFYSLVYDPQQKTLLADKGEIRVGSKYQAEVQRRLKSGEIFTTALFSTGIGTVGLHGL